MFQFVKTKPGHGPGGPRSPDHPPQTTGWGDWSSCFGVHAPRTGCIGHGLGFPCTKQALQGSSVPIELPEPRPQPHSLAWGSKEATLTSWSCGKAAGAASWASHGGQCVLTPTQEASNPTGKDRPQDDRRVAGSSCHSPVTCHWVSTYTLYTLYTGALGRVG